jgi:hypothetical protein
VAKWRNWQTHQTQNLAHFTVRVGSTPTFATIILFSKHPMMGLSAEEYARQIVEYAIEAAALPVEATPSKDIEELFAPLRGLNLDFSRRLSTGRPVEL